MKTLLSNKVRGLGQIFYFDNRWELIFHRLFFAKTQLSVYRLGKLEFIIDRAGGDANGVRDVIVSGMYRDLLKHAHLSNQYPLSLIDLGSNGGGVPLLLSSLGFKIQRMLCVEMNPNTFARLEFNIKRNFDCEYKLLNAAVSWEKRTFLLRLGSGSTADSILPKSHEPARDFVENGKKSYHVQGILFDDAFSALFDPKNDFVDLIKIDIEGAEFDIFTNTGHGFIRRCRNLMMEIHSNRKGTQTKELLAILNDLGFDPVTHDPDNSVYLFLNRHLH